MSDNKHKPSCRRAYGVRCDCNSAQPSGSVAPDCDHCGELAVAPTGGETPEQVAERYACTFYNNGDVKVRLVWLENCADAIREYAKPFQAHLALLESERETQRFAPLGDNHHNAAACPYCNPKLVAMGSDLRKAEAERDKEKARHCTGGDIFEAGRNQLILHQTTELHYLEEIDALKAERDGLRKQNDEIHKLVAMWTIPSLCFSAETILKKICDIFNAALSSSPSPSTNEKGE